MDIKEIQRQIKAHKIELRKVSDLLPYARNSRLHSDWQIKKIADSMKEFGVTNPILIEGDGTIIAGHARCLAAMKLELEEIPCIVLDHLTKAQKKALVIADNQLALISEWDYEILRTEIEDLKIEEFDIEILGLPSFNFDGDITGNIDDVKENLDGIEVTIKVKCDQSIVGDVTESIKAAIQGFAGVTMQA